MAVRGKRERAFGPRIHADGRRDGQTPLSGRAGAPVGQHEGRLAILFLWAVLMGCVVVGSLLPATSAVMAAAGRMHVNDKVLHFCAYLALSLLPVIGFRDRRKGIVAGLSMFLLSVALEAGQRFAPGRAVEVRDVMANGAGVSCGTLLGLPIRMLLAIL